MTTSKHANLMYKTNVEFGESSARHVYSFLLKQEEEYYKNKLDNAVYKRDGAFRCIGSFKNRDDVSCLHQIDTTTCKPINKIDDFFPPFSITHEDLNKKAIELKIPVIEQYT